jgi:hypothetical protein
MILEEAMTLKWGGTTRCEPAIHHIATIVEGLEDSRLGLH